MVAPARREDLQLPEALSDDELVARIRDGGPESFELLMRRYNRRLFRIARGILKDDDEAEDAVQEAYVRAWSSLGQLRDQGNLAPWLYRIASNEALMRRRRLQRDRARLAGVAGEAVAGADPMAGLRSPEAGPAAKLHAAQLRHLLERAVDSLPDGCRDAFILREVEQMSVAETASCLGIEEGAVKTRVHRARRLLQRNLTDELAAAMKGVFEFDGARCDRLVTRVMMRISG